MVNYKVLRSTIDLKTDSKVTVTINREQSTW